MQNTLESSTKLILCGTYGFKCGIHKSYYNRTTIQVGMPQLYNSKIRSPNFSREKAPLPKNDHGSLKVVLWIPSSVSTTALPHKCWV